MTFLRWSVRILINIKAIRNVFSSGRTSDLSLLYKEGRSSRQNAMLGFRASEEVQLVEYITCNADGALAFLPLSHE